MLGVRQLHYEVATEGAWKAEGFGQARCRTRQSVISGPEQCVTAAVFPLCLAVYLHDVLCRSRSSGSFGVRVADVERPLTNRTAGMQE